MSVQRRRLTVGGVALAFAVTVGVAPAAQAVIPSPPSKVLPAALDAVTPYEPQISCDPRSKPGVVAFGALMTAQYQTGAKGTFRTCQSNTSEHYESRALDWMLNVNNPTQKSIANSVTAWLSANNGAMARRFGISYIIWNHKMWREYRPSAGWTAYTGPVPHTDHVHLSFSWDGAMKRTSWWTGKATTKADIGPCRVYAGQFAPLYTTIRTTPCPTKLPAAPVSAYQVAVIGQTSAQIAVAQRRLGVPATGQFGSATFAKLLTWQTAAHVPVTGVLDKATWVKLLVGPAPVVTPPTTATVYTPYKAVVLQVGSRGAAVVVLQRGLKVTADGDFGPKTKAAVVAFQTAQHLLANGIVTRPVWDRLELTTP
jgi:peptidoglycan hydrolase-like protein with peptidoglycan-binding domain